MDDGFIFWPKHQGFHSFSIWFASAIKYRFEKAKVIIQKFRIVSSNKRFRCINYTNSWPFIETDIRHQRPWFPPYDSAHPDHSRNNVPYNLAKRVIVLVSNEEKKL